MRHWLLWLFLGCSGISFSQTAGQFAKHLYLNKLDYELQYLASEGSSHSFHNADSVSYWAGLSYFEEEKYNKALRLFGKFDRPPLRNATYFLKEFARFQTGRKAYRGLPPTLFFADSLRGLYYYQKTAYLTYHQEFSQLDSLHRHIHFQSLPYAQDTKLMLEYEQQLQQIKKRSPLLAGILSAILPGAGKAYYGKPLQGLSSLATIAFLGVQAWDGFRHKRWDSPHFYVYGSLAATFYIGNIWGSVLGVKVARTEQLETIQNEILFNMRIPLDRLLPR